MATVEASLPLPGVTPDATNPPELAWTSWGKPYLAFDDGANEEQFTFSFRLPDNYSTAPKVIIGWSDSAVSAPSASLDTARWSVEVMAQNPNGSTAAADADSFHTANVQDDEADNTNAKAMMEVSITLTNNDSMTAGDDITLRIGVNSSHANHTLANDAWMWACTFTYDTA